MTRADRGDVWLREEARSDPGDGDHSEWRAEMAVREDGGAWVAPVCPSSVAVDSALGPGVQRGGWGCLLPSITQPALTDTALAPRHTCLSALPNCLPPTAG